MVSKSELQADDFIDSLEKSENVKKEKSNKLIRSPTSINPNGIQIKIKN